MKKWLDEDYPAITKKAEIQWGDETVLCNDSQHGRSYSPRGKTPAIRLPAKRERINLISSATNQGKVRFMIYKNTLNAKTFIKFMMRLIKDATRKIFLILDNLRVHHPYVVPERKLGFFVKVKEDQNFNRRNTLGILRIKIFI